MDGQVTRIARWVRHGAPPVAIAFAVLILVVTVLAACDPGYAVTIRNDTDVPLTLSGPSSPITESKRTLPKNQEIKMSFLEYPTKEEPVFDLVALDPEGRTLHIVLTRAELEARNLTVVIRREDFASPTPAATR